MRTRIGSLVLLILGGCAGDSSTLQPLSDGFACEGSRLKIEQLKQELDKTLRAREPSALSVPTLARQNEMMQAMRSAAAQQKVRQALAKELTFQSDYCP